MNQVFLMKEVRTGKIDIDFETELQPETELERRLLQQPDFVKGLYWGVPRYGHPEGEIYKHIKEVLENIDRLRLDKPTRQRLRLITFAHDTFKYKEDKSIPRDWSKHHSIYAKKFLEKFTNDQLILDITELHDEAYYVWRTIHLHHSPHKGQIRLQSLLDRIEQNIQLYYLFFKCDTLTGDKNLAPLRWFEQHISGIEIKEI